MFHCSPSGHYNFTMTCPMAAQMCRLYSYPRRQLENRTSVVGRYLYYPCIQFIGTTTFHDVRLSHLLIRPFTHLFFKKCIECLLHTRHWWNAANETVELMQKKGLVFAHISLSLILFGANLRWCMSGGHCGTEKGLVGHTSSCPSPQNLHKSSEIGRIRMCPPGFLKAQNPRCWLFPFSNCPFPSSRTTVLFLGLFLTAGE